MYSAYRTQSGSWSRKSCWLWLICVLLSLCRWLSMKGSGSGRDERTNDLPLPAVTSRREPDPGLGLDPLVEPAEFPDRRLAAQRRDLRRGLAPTVDRLGARDPAAPAAGEQQVDHRDPLAPGQRHEPLRVLHVRGVHVDAVAGDEQQPRPGAVQQVQLLVDRQRRVLERLAAVVGAE